MTEETKTQTKRTLYRYITQGGREVDYFDADGQYTPEVIRKHWAESFPELSNATVEAKDEVQTIKTRDTEGNETEVEIDRLVTFSKRVGTKGALYRITGAIDYLVPRTKRVNRIVEAPSEAEARQVVLEADFTEDQCPVWLADPAVTPVEAEPGQIAQRV